MTAGDVLHLDLSGGGDEGLLVPFGKAKEAAPATEEHNPLFAPPPAYQRTRRGFFRNRKERHSNKPAEDDDSKQEDNAVVKKKQITFSFPNAPLEFAETTLDDEPLVSSKTENSATEATSLQKKKEEERSSDEDSSSDEEESETNKQNDRASKTRDGMNAAPSTRFRDSIPTSSSNPHASEEKNGLMQEDDPSETKLHMAGYGNSKPEEDTPMSAMSRMFRRIGRRSDMKSMKIATEDTKDDRTFGETVTHCVQVALVPEVYAEDMEGEGNLGFYRHVSSTPRKSGCSTSQQRVLDQVNKWKKENDGLKKRVIALRKRVAELSEENKTKDLETMVWKQRAQEFEEELRQYKGKQADKKQDDESESGIDHEWKEEQESSQAKKEQTLEVKEEMLIDTTVVPKKVVFDPLEASEETPATDRDGEEAESEDEIDQQERNMMQDSAPEVKEEVLVDTNIVAEPVEFDPMKGSSQEEDNVTVNAKDDLFDLITSLSSDVEALKELNEPPKEHKGTVSSAEEKVEKANKD